MSAARHDDVSLAMVGTSTAAVSLPPTSTRGLLGQSRRSSAGSYSQVYYRKKSDVGMIGFGVGTTDTRMRL